MSVELLVAPLKKILDAELARGNTVQEVSDWPPKCQLIVILKRPFHRPYELEPHVEFRELNDPHYWKSEYSYRGGTQVLACSFG